LPGTKKERRNAQVVKRKGARNRAKHSFTGKIQVLKKRNVFWEGTSRWE